MDDLIGPDGMCRVVVVGAGASGILVATHLITALSPRHEVVLIDPAPVDRCGPAYSTGDDRHLLNVPASGMSALPRDPEHFLRWLRRHHRPDFQPHDFAPRRVYRHYLFDLLEQTTTFPSNARLTRLHDRVLDVTQHGTRHRVHRAHGTALSARAVVLATGSVPGTSWAPESLIRSDRFVADPWRPGALEALPEQGDLLLVGTGLTMVDLAISLDREDRTLQVTSRSDRLPERHVLPTVPPVPPPPGITRLAGLEDLTRVVRSHVARTVTETGDWRAAVDGLRPVTAQLWRSLSEDEKKLFASGPARLWDIHRHRMSPLTAERFDAVVDSGRLIRHRGEVRSVTTSPGGLEVHLADGTELSVAAVLNCTGPVGRVAADPLLARLVETGVVRPAPLGLGIQTADDGRVGTGSGSHRNAIWALGALRRGDLWESTAVPEIRDQAYDIARSVAGALRGESRGEHRDLLGLPLSTHRVAASWYDRALGRLLRLQTGVDEALYEAVDLDPGFTQAHAARALLAHEWGTGADWSGSLQAAHTAAANRELDDREASFLDAVTTRLRTDEATGAAALLRHIRLFPRDGFAVSVAVPTVAFGGLTSGRQSAELVEWLGRSYGDDWWYAGQLAFIRQDQERWSEAEDLAAHALSVEPASGHAVHARAHVYYETGQHHSGLEWLDGWIRRYGQRAFSSSHFSWHAALHELALDDAPAARIRYERELAPGKVDGTRAVVDSGSLLWRGRMTGSWPGTLRAPALRHAAPDWLTAPPSPFAAMHAALTLAVTDDAVGLGLLREHVASSPDPVLREVVDPLCRALDAVLAEEWSAALPLLARVLTRADELGGSAAQREVIAETQVFALTRAGQTDRAAHLLDARLNRRHSPLDARRLVALRAATEMPGPPILAEQPANSTSQRGTSAQ